MKSIFSITLAAAAFFSAGSALAVRPASLAGTTWSC